MNSVFSHNGFQISVIKDLQTWNQLALQWDNLWEITPGASVFMSHGFLTTWWRQRNKFMCRLHILAVKDGAQKIVGFVPLVWGWNTMSGFPLRTLSLMHQAWLMDRPQILYSENRQNLLQALCRYFISIGQAWDVISLQEQLLDQSVETAFASLIEHHQDYRLDIIEDSFAPFLSFPSTTYSWDDYLKTRTKKHRKKWRYLQSRLKRAGRVEITRHSEGPDLEKGLALYRQMEARSWKKHKRVHVSSWHYRFYRKFINPNQSRNRIHVILLNFDGRPIAGVVSLEHRRRYAALHSSFDDNFADFSPGFLIGGYDIQWAIENGFVEYDFMSGFLSDKLQWTDTFRRTHLVRIVRKDAYGGAFHFVKFRLNPKLIEYREKNALFQYWKKRHDRKLPQMNTSKFKKHNKQLGIVDQSKES